MHVRPDADHDGEILLLESSEDMPPAGQIYWNLRAMGERAVRY
jgi:hypothetical protein